MFQPQVKQEFVSRYCNPKTDSGWIVFVDIDASEEGRTGGEGKTEEAKEKKKAMLDQATIARSTMVEMGVRVGGSRNEWSIKHSLPFLDGDSDIVAFHKASKVLLIAEVEGASSGQPEQKLYKAIGQIVRAITSGAPEGWNAWYGVVIHDAEPDKVPKRMERHLERLGAVTKLGVSGLALMRDSKEDRWVLGRGPVLRES